MPLESANTPAWVASLVTEMELKGEAQYPGDLQVPRYGGEPLSIQVRKRSTSSAGQGPSQGMLPAASFS